MFVFHPTPSQWLGGRNLKALAFTLVLLFSASHTSLALAALSESEAIQKMQQQYGGKVLDSQQVKLSGRPAYRIKLLQPSGRVLLLLVDGDSGRVLSQSGKNQ